ncbi:MAG: Anthranilate phosphoribosyltransferase [Candidatus Nomurabacteria bacterium GW2011_GWA2_40_9]|uniref:Anthranilate phosphoribosyltransferase n=1 Tax=Candidatus Nomurabacteria bacterium GW2011_GWA2_40_9 TaxID=1618734 RepID=A0A0G0TPI4_9BACT|nr:MAG: Anthranilate phosphoribosyltransferase [Candidatus Nomurabacteria bacterium GW2011_GWA2_40_9]
MIQEAISRLIEKKDLTQEEAGAVMSEIMSGKATDAQIAGFLVALRLKGETIDEITACAKVMREKAFIIKPKPQPLIDVVGTGGDKSGTFNISTCAALVVAGAGIAVAKHGNKSVSSKSGSADVLAALGVKIDLEPKKVEQCINEIGFGYMFAPKFHEAMKYAIGPRKELGIRTVFNILGPLTNPAEAPYELMGVFSPDLTEPLAAVIGKLGCKHAFVVHGNGLDEITIEGETKVSEYKDGHVRNFTIKPTDFGIKMAGLNEIKGGSPEECAKIIMNILAGKEKGPKRDVVLLNAGAAIFVAGKAGSIKKGIELAKDSIDSGKALKKLEQLKEWAGK